MSRTIPEISDERLEELAARIKPVIKTEKGYKNIKPVDLRSTAFTWDPQPWGCTRTRLVEVGSCTSYHNWGYYGLFKPSIAEVLVAIPEELLDVVEFFCLDTSSVQQEGEPLLHKPDQFNRGGYHRAMVTLLRSPE